MSFKEWFEIKVLAEAMTPEEAEEILGVKSGDPDLATAYRRASIKNHPDRGGNTADMKRVNAAFELLSGKTKSRSIPKPERNDKPFKGNETYANLYYCEYIIEEKSKQSGPVSPYTFHAWDGTFFRGVFTVKTNPENFDFAGMVMEKWNNSFPHDTKAVFVDIGNKSLLLVRLDGKDVSGQNRTFEHESFNKNPSNDPNFVEMLRNYF